MVISSLVVEAFPEHAAAAAEELAKIEGVEVHGVDPDTGKIVVTIEAESVERSHDTAATFIEIDGVINVSLIYANFEDENLPA